MLHEQNIDEDNQILIEGMYKLRFLNCENKVDKKTENVDKLVDSCGRLS